MNFSYKNTIMELKSRFFDIINTSCDLSQYGEILKKMCYVVKDVMKTDGVDLFLCCEWKQQIYMEASTSDESLPKSIVSYTEIEDLLKDQILVRKPVPFEFFSPFDLLILLRNNQQLVGILAIVGEENVFKQYNYSMDLVNDFCNETSSFLQKIQSLFKILSDETRYKRLFSVTEKFHSTMDVDIVLREVIDTLQEVYPTFNYFLHISQDIRTYKELPIKDIKYDSENSLAMQAFVSGIVQLEDSLMEKKSILYAPLKGKQGVYGVLEVVAPDTFLFPNNEIEFIALLANTAGSAIENARLYQQSRRLISDLQLINETTHHINAHLKLSEMTSFLVKQIKKSFLAEEVAFIFISGESNEVKVQKGSTAFFFMEEAKPYIQYVEKRIQSEKDPVYVGDISLKGYQHEWRYKSIMAVPMIHGNVIIGFALVLHHLPYFFSFDTFKLLQSLIYHSTLAFTNSLLREELERMVITDHLTKLYSRNYLDKRIKQSMGEDQQGTFILIDIDNFKQINDNYGHQVGDEVLVQVAKIIKNNIRGSDIGARWGGEELAIYLPKVPLHIGATVAERLVKKVCEQSHPNVTISCGISHWEKTQDDNFQNLFKRADRALYKAKETGKNKVVIQESEE